ncbi:MAG: pitrilysin family protein [Clostridiales bacterium]|nr:pitrilysin family protein [Clostridiales bacterium]
MKDMDISKTVFGNGLTLITVCRESDIFSIGVGIKAGSLLEDENNNGISHLVEHMLFKGTSKRDMAALNSDIEKLTGDIDIYTTYHQTVLNASVMKNRAEQIIEIISDMLMNSAFPRREFNLEKKVISEEIKMEKDDCENAAYSGLYKTVFKENWYKYNITGTRKTLMHLKRDAAKKFYKENYVPGNVCICTASSFPHEQMAAMVYKYFGGWHGEKTKQIVSIPRDFSNRKVLRHKKGITQSHIVYGFDINSLDKKERIALALLNKKFGSGPNSVLFRELRDLKGYAYNVYSDIDFIPEIRMLYIYAAVSCENLKNSLNIIDSIVDRFSAGNIYLNEGNLRMIKDMFITEIEIAMESSEQMIDYLLEGQLNYNNPKEYEKDLSIMEDVHIEDLKNTAKQVLQKPVIYILNRS